MKGVLQSIGRVLNSSGSSVTKEELFNQLFAQSKQKFAIDPATIVNHQNNGDLTQALQRSQQFAQRTLQQHIDTGALELDRLLGSVGIPSNLSETLKYPTTHYVLEPGVYYKRQHKVPVNQPRPTVQSPGVIQEFIGFKDTPMMDWDVAGPYHAERNATIRHLGDVEDRIQNYLQQNPPTAFQQAPQVPQTMVSNDLAAYMGGQGVSTAPVDPTIAALNASINPIPPMAVQCPSETRWLSLELKTKFSAEKPCPKLSEK